MKTNCFLIRTRDNAIFDADADRDGFHYRVKYKPRRWWQFRGRFVYDWEQWMPDDESEYEIVHRDHIVAGVKIMQERGEL